MVFDTLKGILVNKLMVPAEDVTEEATLESVELDSLAAVELSLLLEKEFGFELSDEELTGAGTVGGIADLLEERSGAPR